MIERFIRCRLCNQIFPIHPFFGDFGDSARLPGVEWSDEDVAFRREFACAHADHPREELRVNPDTVFSERPGYEPVRTSYFEATNGREKFLIKRTKAGLMNPARYEIFPGRMEITNRAIETQEADLRREISAAGNASRLPAETVEAFIAALREEAAAISPFRLFEAVEETLEGDSSRILYASLTPGRWSKILDKLAGNLQASEIHWIRDFIQNHRHPGDVLSLLVYRDVSFRNDGSPVLPAPGVSALHP